MSITDEQRWKAAVLAENFPADGPSAYTRAIMYERLALWTRHSDATGRKLGERLRDWSWSGLARRGRYGAHKARQDLVGRG